MISNHIHSMTPTMALGFLRSFMGKKISLLIRYSWWPGEDVPDQCGISDDLAFSLTAGPLAIHFEDGSILGAASDPSLNSIIVWDEAARYSDRALVPLENDDEFFPIQGTGPFATSYWKQFIGQALSGLTLLKRETVKSKEMERPSEVGLQLHFENGKSFILSHGLHDNSDDFSVLDEPQIPAIDLMETTLG
jgi:hypothetical protein